MKNQDIFEVFKHLKTLFGGNPPKKDQPQNSAQENTTPSFLSENSKNAERKLRDFHLKHEALARKIITENASFPANPGTVISFREKRNEVPNPTPDILAKNIENKAEATPLFPPSFP
ncbi:MAG: hypothetical protein E7363_04545 [Clostridiales bacterium]|nr:hypothetical protein [Clostridiales bacterium]